MINRAFDITIVFGAGPVKAVVTNNELSIEQQNYWLQYRKEPVFTEEPDFSIVDDVNILLKLSNLKKNAAQTEFRIQLQHNEEKALNTWGKLNCLAAGHMLVSGMTKMLIITGGHTKPPWVKNTLSKALLDSWPSEAKLMKNTIISNFGEEYRNKTSRDISETIITEDNATNTLENFVYTLNNNPELITGNKTVALLTADHHVRRATLLAHIFSLWEAPFGQLSAQEVLREHAIIEKNAEYADLMKFFRDSFLNPNIEKLLVTQSRWENGLTNPKFLTYWLGYIGEIKYPKILQNVINKLKSPQWIDAARKAFTLVGLDFDYYMNVDISTFAKENPKEYKEFMSQISILKKNEYRSLPTFYTI